MRILYHTPFYLKTKVLSLFFNSFLDLLRTLSFSIRNTVNVPVRRSLSTQNFCLPRSCIRASFLPWESTRTPDSCRYTDLSHEQRISAHEYDRAVKYLRNAMAAVSAHYRYVHGWHRLPASLPQVHNNHSAPEIPAPSDPPPYRNYRVHSRYHFSARSIKRSLPWAHNLWADHFWGRGIKYHPAITSGRLSPGQTPPAAAHKNTPSRECPTRSSVSCPRLLLRAL